MPGKKDGTKNNQNKRFSKSTRQGDSDLSSGAISKNGTMNILNAKPVNLVIPNIVPDKSKYEFYLNNSEKNTVELFFKNNKVDTTKYNCFTFLPKALFYQFMRLANVYFLATAIIQCIPIISPLGPATAILPLVFVLCVSLIREATEDMARAKMDKEQNDEQVEVYRNKQWTKVTSGELMMGEIVKVKKDDAFPADLVLLDSSLPEGICFIETGTLDGEKTLKLKNPPPFTKGKFNNQSQSEGEKENEKKQEDTPEENNGENLSNNGKENNIIMELENEGAGDEEQQQSGTGRKPGKAKTLRKTGKKGSVAKKLKKKGTTVENTNTSNNTNMDLMENNMSLKRNKKTKKAGSANNQFTKLSNNLAKKADDDASSTERSKNSTSNILLKRDKAEGNSEASMNNFDLSGYCQCDLPNAELYQLNGKMIMFLNTQQEEFPLDAKQLLLKGAKLRNTEWILGIIIYAGHNCKLLKNAKNPLVKYSSLEKLMNKLLVFILIIQGILSIVSAITNAILYNKNLKEAYYIETSLSHGVTSFLTFFTYFLLLNTMIPISLIVTLEIVKIAQGLFLSADVDSYSSIRKKFAKVNSCSLNEELGMVDFIFSDKTGTLTCNRMALKFNVIADQCFEFIRGDEENNKELREKEGILPYENYSMLDIEKHSVCENKSYVGYKVSSEENPSCSFLIANAKDAMEEYWQALALCHDCTIQAGEYIGMSPDSIELVKTAKVQGYEFVEGESNAQVVLDIGEEGNKNKKIFNKLMNIEFSSERKRESIIVSESNGLIKLYIKGADSIIEERLNTELTPPAVLENTRKFVGLFSAQGYRTLYIGMRVLSQKEYALFSQELIKAQMDSENKDEKVKAAYAMVEKNITLLGATIVEDKLQDKVPDTIQQLRTAGIKIWMLTGDKMNTAYNIGLSCNLISKDMKTFFIQGIAPEKDNNMQVINNEERENVIINFCKEYQNYKGNFNSMENPKFALIVDEKALLTITEKDTISNMFLEIAKFAVAVICCRVSPLQKSQVVKMMKAYDPSKVTLAIGDGGNDVSMIMEAHIGVGIYGEEGLRAVQSSDYAIGEFKVLKRLLLFHGYTNLMRNSDLILYFFYKNFVFTIVHFFYGFYNNFSGQTIIDDWFITCFNLVFTSLPLGVRAILDIDFRPSDAPVVEKNLSYLYLEGRDYPRFTPLTFGFTLIRGIIHGLINFIVVLYTVYDSCLDKNGNFSDLWYISVTLYTNILLIVTCNLVINTRYQTILNVGFVLVTTIILFILFLLIVHHFLMFNSNSTMTVAFSNGKVYMSIIFVTGFCFLIDLGIFFYQNVFVKSIRNVVKKGIHNGYSLEQIEAKKDMIALKKKYDGVGIEDIDKEGKEGENNEEENKEKEDEEIKEIPIENKNPNGKNRMSLKENQISKPIGKKKSNGDNSEQLSKKPSNENKRKGTVNSTKGTKRGTVKMKSNLGSQRSKKGKKNSEPSVNSLEDLAKEEELKNQQLKEIENSLLESQMEHLKDANGSEEENGTVKANSPHNESNGTVSVGSDEGSSIGSGSGSGSASGSASDSEGAGVEGEV
ncbi:MAG: phospholipid-translocating P-type ATPase [archaeon]|nr:phospholipid-translocating P-type ATPase [archaeon]